MKRGVRACGNHRVMGDHEDGLANLSDKFLDGRDDFVSAPAVQVPSRLVAEKKCRVGDDGAGDGNALLLTAGELARIMVHAVGKPYDTESGVHMLAALRGGKLGQQQWKLDVLKRGERGNKLVHVEKETHVAGGPVRELAAGHVDYFVGVNRDRPAC